jgi:hypothetical protein
VPASANKLKNSGFELGSGAALDGWTAWLGGYKADRQVKRSGAQSVRIETDSPTAAVGASQSVTLNQTTPAPLIVRGWSRAEKVSGERGKGYSLYVDIYYADGTKLYGQIVPFNTGTHDWQFGETLIETTKPIATVTVHTMLRGNTGTAWFDDVFLAEDRSRVNNLARQAKVKCDSFFSNYHERAINDGVTQTTGLHWTEADWASAETNAPHWVELRWDKPVTTKEVAIYWSLDAGTFRTSRRVEIQAVDGESWKTIQVVSPPKPEPETRATFTPIATAALRLYQPLGQGIEGRPNLMWIREVEVY